MGLGGSHSRGAAGTRLVVLVGLLSACATPLDPGPRTDLGTRAPHHIVMFERRGQPVELTDKMFVDILPYARQEPDAFEQHVTMVLEAARCAWRRRAGPAPGCTAETEDGSPAAGAPRGIVVYIHGGLNTQRGTLERAKRLSPQIARGGYYPIFLNWQSSLVSGYFLEHLLFYRRGKEVAWGFTTTPFVLAGDLLGGLARSPFVAISELRSVGSAIPFVNRYELITPREDIEAREVAQELIASARENPEDAVAISVGENRYTRLEKFASVCNFLITLPLRLVISPFLQGAGSSSWSVLQRRVQLLVRDEERYRDGDASAPPPSAMLYFFERLRQLQQEEGVPVTLVGHSMGTIVIGELLRADTFGSSRPYTRFVPEVESIVFMASASSVPDYESNVLAYMQSEVGSQTRLYHLTLHPDAERREAWAVLDVAPRGSLLVWIDGFLSNPTTLQHRTAGQQLNLMQSLRALPENLRQRVHLRTFDAGMSRAPDGHPQRHGDFNDEPFWRPEFWEPTAP
jgi:pimeloyl-ACP methyl ester carboxylesterase